jgi:hypothetical protein
MSDIEQAKQILSEGTFTCVLCCGEEIYTSEVAGISPMIDFIRGGIDLRGFSAADKIVGKAAAMLFISAGVKEVYGEVMSESAAGMLFAHGVTASYGTLTDRIVNREGTGLCPMETAVLGIDDPAKAFDAVSATLAALRKKKEMVS